MPFTLTIGNQNLALNQLTDLASLFKQNAQSGMNFLSVLPSVDQPIGDFSLLDKNISLSYASNPQKWNLDGGAFTFGISGNASGTIQVFSPGQALFSYTPSLPALNGFSSATPASTVSITAPAGQYCVGITLQLTLDVNASGSGNVDFVGIKGTADFNGTYSFAFYKAIDPASTTRDALVAAFQSFTLPLNDNTFKNLSVGDAIVHNFSADLKLGMGVSVGIPTVQIAQSIKAPLLNPPAGVPTITAQANPTVGPSISLPVSFEYTGSFEAYIFKESDTIGHYHLYRTSKLDASFGIDASVSLISNATVTVGSGNVSQAISSAVSGNTLQTITQIVAQNTSAQSELNAAVQDINASISNILKPIQDVKAELQASIETIDSKALLLNLTIDLTPNGKQDGFDLAAWDNISSGDFVAALQQQHSGITVDAGSGLEQIHHSKADLKFTFLNFTAEWTTTRINDFSIVYGGNNSISFINNVGLDNITNISKGGAEIQFYFTTIASVDAAGNVSVEDPDLHVNLKSTDNTKFGIQIAKFLSLIATGSPANDAYSQMKLVADNANATIELDLVFKPSAYQKIQSSPKPLGTVANEDSDKLNFGAFASSVWNFNDDVSNIADFSYQTKLDLSYNVWAAGNNYLNFGPLPGDFVFPDPRLPNRGLLLQPAPSTEAGLAPALNVDSISTDDLISIVFTLNVGASFMNLCADLQGIGFDPADSPETAFTALKSETAAILHQDVNGSYLVPTACALAELVLGEGATVAYDAPTLPTAQDPGYKLTVEFA